MEIQKKQTGLGIAPFIFGIVGMLTSCIIIGIIPCVIGLILSIVVLSSENSKKGFAIAGTSCSITGIVIFLFLCVVIFSGKTTETTGNEEKQTEIKENTITNNFGKERDKEKQEIPKEKEIVETELNIDDLTEEKYKEQCKEMFYDDVFFSDENFVGEYVKLHLFLSEKYFFTADAMYNDTIKTLHDENNLYKDYYKSCVLREGTNSYVGQQIYVYFSQDYDLDPLDYSTGQKLVMYGEVVHCVTNTWDGYNQVCFMPKYTEEE